MVQRAPPAGAARLSSARRVRRRFLPPLGGSAPRSGTQLTKSPKKPGRFKALITGNVRGEATIRHKVGNIHFQHDRYRDALEAYEATLAIEESIGDRRGAAIARGNIGNVHQARGEYDRALTLYQEALAAFEEVGDRHSVDIARPYITLDAARAYITKGRIQAGSGGAGIITVQQGIEDLRLLSIPRHAASEHVHVADLTYTQEGGEAAIRYLDEHWSFIQQYGEAEVRAEAFVVRARARSSLGDTAGAMADAQEALAFYRAQNVRTALAICLAIQAARGT